MRSRIIFAALLTLIPTLAACEGHGEHRDDDRGRDRDSDRDHDRRSDLRGNIEKLMGPHGHRYALCQREGCLGALPKT